MTAVLGGPAGVRWSAAAPRSVGRRNRDRLLPGPVGGPVGGPVVVPPVVAEPRLRLTSRCRSLLLVAGLLAVVGAGVVHGSGPLGTAAVPSRTVEGPALAPGLPLGTVPAGQAAGGPTAGTTVVRTGSVQAVPASASGVVIVTVGDSLWGIAMRCSGAGPATAVKWIRAANGLHGSLLQPGQRLVVPAGIRCT